ncbi:MAG: response regulator [Asticcacaulis sp.]
MSSSETSPITETAIAQATLDNLRAREDFFKLMSHEIRTPLNGVLGMLSLLARTTLTDEQKSYLGTAQESGEHLMTLVNDLLDYARLEAGHINLEVHTVRLEPLLQSVAELLSPRAYQNGIEIVWQLDPRLESIQADEGRLRQILYNLAGNAIKFTRKGGVIIDVVLTSEGLIRFGVRDTGEGIPPEARERIFEAFGQVHPSHATRYGGAGLGLVVVQKLVEAMKATLHLESEPGIGTHFVVEFSVPYSLRKSEAQSLPENIVLLTDNTVLAEGVNMHLERSHSPVRQIHNLSDWKRNSATVLLADRKALPEPVSAPNRRSLILLAPEEREEISQWRDSGWAGYLIKPLRRVSVQERVTALSKASLKADSEDERVSETALKDIRALLVEDNPVNAMLAQILLQREGCHVERASSGEEAVDILKRHSFDLIFMDLGLPGLDGIGATRQLRSMGLETPIIALTANAYEEDRRACLAAGMNDFLTKPIEVNALRQHISRWRGNRTKAHCQSA